MFEIVFRDSSLYPKQLPLYCLVWLITSCADRVGFITTRATIVAQGFFVITRHLLQLERCSNPLQIQQV